MVRSEFGAYDDAAVVVRTQGYHWRCDATRDDGEGTAHAFWHAQQWSRYSCISIVHAPIT